MRLGIVVAICITPAANGPMTSLRAVRALAGKGLEGDRYCLGVGTYSKTPGSGRQVTLVELESIEALQRDYGVALPPTSARRNIVTQGVALNHLVGQHFRVGAVTFVGARLCEPCAHLEGLTRPGVLRGLVHRGGLRADVLSDGLIQVGDTIESA
jgi:MOSC domain-containing protein YiiM